MKDTIITFETAKLAYEKGFNLNDKGYYVPMYCVDGELMKEKLGYQKELPETFEKGFIIAPTQSLLQKWLREVHNTIIGISLDTLFKRDTYCIFIYQKVGDLTVSRPLINELFSGYNTYEEALEVGLQEALKLIK